MTRVCQECGRDVPEDMDFCPHCGSDRPFINRGDNGAVETTCPSCGAPFLPGDRFCGTCGAALPNVSSVAFMPQMRRNGMAAVIVSLIAGMFNVFGLGHIILRSYSRGAMFLLISLVIWYLNGWSIMSSSMLFLLLEIMVFFYQTMDVVRIAYSPEGR